MTAITALAAALLALAAPAWCKGGAAAPPPTHGMTSGNQGTAIIEDDTDQSSMPDAETDAESSGSDEAGVDDSSGTAAMSDGGLHGQGLVPLTPFKPGSSGAAGGELGTTGGGARVDPIAAPPPKAPLSPMASNSKTMPPAAPAPTTITPPVFKAVDTSGPCPEDQYERRLWRFNDALDLSQATIMNNPPALASWPVTAHITNVTFGSGSFSFQFDKADGPGRWPDTPNTPSMGPLQYTLGVAEYINGQWYASAAIQYWHGRPQNAPTTFKKDWYYAADRWGPLCYHQPIPGEEIGVFVVAGNVRNVKDDGSLSPVRERSNVVLVPMPSDGAAPSFNFGQ